MKKNFGVIQLDMKTIVIFIVILCMVFYIISNRFKSRVIHAWFEVDALKKGPKHVQSGWNYLKKEDFDAIVMHSIQSMKPSIHQGASVYEMGCGVGAALETLRDKCHVGSVGGCDFSQNAIEKARLYFPDSETSFFVMDMTKQNENIPNNHYDHVVSFGALGMYLKRDGLIEAIHESIRITKPGGSLCITNMIEPGGKTMGSIVEAMPKSFWLTDAKTMFPIENVEIRQMSHESQGDRYLVTFTKKMI